MAENMGSSSPDSDGRRNYAAAAPGSSGTGDVLSAGADGGGLKEQDRLLPIANVGRIMKQILPRNAKISKESKETMQECVSEFISFVTAEASDRCHKEKRKTVNGDDICWALSTLGFDDYVEPMRRYLQKYREMEGDKAASSKQAGGGDEYVISSEQQKKQQLHSDQRGQWMFNVMERNSTGDSSTSRKQ